MIPIIKQKICSSFLRPVTWCSTCTCSTKATTKLPKVQWQENTVKAQGQPTYATHPHLLQEGEVVPGLRLEEFQERRRRLMECIYQHSSRHDKSIKQHLVVIPAATKLYMTEKIPYVFRQNTDFLYMSGCLEPDSALVLSGVGRENYVSTLFMRKRDSHSELWDGPRTGIEGAPELFGVNQALPLTEMEPFLASFARSHRTFMLWYDFMQPLQPNVHQILQDFLGESWNKIWESPKPLIHQLRLLKSPSEVALMKATCQIASDAISATIGSSHVGVTEHQLFARVDYECRVRGAEYLAYPPVVAGGSRANIIHYINNNQVVHQGEMVLMDAGCEYHGYTSDITRTWPVSGRFSSEQRNLYEAVLDIQMELIQLCSGFPTLDSLFHTMCTSLGQRLQDLGILPARMDKEELARVAYSFCPHHVSHYLGMDVHDTALIPRSIKLQPGMVITVEPGIYVNPKNKLAPPQYHGLGVRIEDDVLITENGPVVLSASCPKHVDDIESLIANNSNIDF